MKLSRGVKHVTAKPVYETTDGKTFFEATDANKHQKGINEEKKIEKAAKKMEEFFRANIINLPANPQEDDEDIALQEELGDLGGFLMEHVEIHGMDNFEDLVRFFHKFNKEHFKGRLGKALPLMGIK